MVQSLWKKKFKLNIHILYDLFLDIYPRKNWNTCLHKDSFLAALFGRAKHLKTTEISINWQMVNEFDRHIPPEYLRMEMKTLLIHCNTTDGTQKHDTEWKPLDTIGYIWHDSIFMTPRKIEKRYNQSFLVVRDRGSDNKEAWGNLWDDRGGFT